MYCSVMDTIIKMAMKSGSHNQWMLRLVFTNDGVGVIVKVVRELITQ